MSENYAFIGIDFIRRYQFNKLSEENQQKLNKKIKLKLNQAKDKC